jgi:ADP-ribose pyrophosphatase YjhB (NUDIX family)
MAKKTKLPSPIRRAVTPRTKPAASSSRVGKAANEPIETIEVIARGVLVHGSSVLLCQSVKHGYLYLPGGHVEFGESAPVACAREFLEECGVRVTPGPLLMVHEGTFASAKREHHEVNLVFHVELTHPLPRARAAGSASRSQGKGVPEGAAATLPKIASREAGLRFVWVDLASAVDLDIRPPAAKAFLAAGAGQATIPVPDASNPASGPEWVSTVGE